MATNGERTDRAPGWVRWSRGDARRRWLGSLVSSRARYGWRVNATRVARARFHADVAHLDTHPAKRPPQWQRDHAEQLHHQALTLADTADDLATAAAILDRAEQDHLDEVTGSALGHHDPPPPTHLDEVRNGVTAPRPGPAAGIAPAA